MTMADTIAVMNTGRVEQLGGSVELYENPASVFVANFLGQSNLLHGTVLGRDGELLTVETSVGRLRVPTTRCSASDPDCLVGVRPEKLHVLPEGDATDDRVPHGHNVIAGTVTDASFIGVSTQYQVALAGDQTVTVFSQNTGTAVLRPGDPVRLHWDVGHTFALAGSEDVRSGLSDPDAVD